MRTTSTQWSAAVVLVLAVGGGVGCKKGPEEPARGSSNRAKPSKPAAPKGSSEVARIRRSVADGTPEKERQKAVDALVRGWPGTRAALPAVLDLVRRDRGNRGGYALLLGRLGKALVPEVNAMVGKAPGHKPTLLAAGVLAYHLVLRGGLTKRTEGEFEAIRTGLRPSFEHFWRAFLKDLKPEGEILQGVAVGAEEAIKRFRPPFPENGLTRICLVLYFALSRTPDQAVVSAPVRKRLREQASPLAAYLAPALANAGNDPTGESPAALMLGLAVLGTASGVALSRATALHRPERCPVFVKALSELLEQSGPRAVALAIGPLEGCAKQTRNPAARTAAHKLLTSLGSRAAVKR